MIEEVSALRTSPVKSPRIIKIENTAEATKDTDEVLQEKLSYVKYAEQNDVIDPFTAEHFDYLRYIGVKD